MVIDFSLSTILQILTLLGVLFAIYKYFRSPQEQDDIKMAVFDEKFEALKGQIKTLEQNHIHTLQVKLDDHVIAETAWQLEMTKQVTKVETLLEQIMKK